MTIAPEREETINEYMSRQPNIEGDYAEIVAWMDQHPNIGVRYSDSHGRERGDHFNVGLFSMVTEHLMSPRDCLACSGEFTPVRAFNCNFDKKVVFLATDTPVDPIEIENPEQSHLIRF